MECRNTVALVTGAAKRVGREIALELNNAGCSVAIHYHQSREAAASLVNQIQSKGKEAIAVSGDLLDPAVPPRIIAEVLDRLGRLDVLVNNASIFEPEPADEFDPVHWQEVFQVNVFAPAALVAAGADALAAGGCGKIINLCDIAADRPWKSHQAYCASKAALVNLTRSMARRLAPRVRVNGVSPGIAVFPDDYSETLRQRLVEEVPLGRSGKPEDIARTVRFLVEHGDYITGQIVNVDGGRSIV